MKVLIIEDETNAADLFESLARGCGYETKIVGTGHGALQQAASDWPDVFIVDWTLPDGMVGKDIIMSLQAMANGRPMKIIATTASVDKTVKQTIKETGVFAFIEKPFLPTDLIDLLNKAKE